jgi:cyclase
MRRTLRARIIPFLLLREGGLVKTVQFGDSKYVGDPLNAVRIFNEKEVDEIVVLDIDATAHGREPNYKLIANLASECRMPLCYGGGVAKASQVERIVSLGVEKVAISSAAFASPSLIEEAAHRVGNQSIVVVLDVKRSGPLRKRYAVHTHNATKVVPGSPAEWARIAQDKGAGEIVISSIDRDGTMQGYDYTLIDEVKEAVTLPITAVGGAGSSGDLSALVNRYGTIGAGAASIFVLKGKYRAVLIQYPTPAERKLIAQIDN